MQVAAHVSKQALRAIG